MKLSLAVVAVAAAFSSTVMAHSVASPAELEMRAPRGKHNKHEHPRHDFRRACVCEPDRCPSFLNPKMLCECKASHLDACYLKSQRGCPKPSAKRFLCSIYIKYLRKNQQVLLTIMAVNSSVERRKDRLARELAA
ncbi:hypothetical protein QBC40DRAFT_224877 [Triangularia verruculosa]|uniref:Uncharacterized protein n=1 Tax=Triangularia verruculosa TaxID=2587418 RepID=A0AAN7AVC9_9PEZI|nr:hypothetical protein QBC40DRAFT_224877 [Triangularia verruculosa]